MLRLLGLCSFAVALAPSGHISSAGHRRLDLRSTAREPERKTFRRWLEVTTIMAVAIMKHLRFYYKEIKNHSFSFCCCPPYRWRLGDNRVCGMCSLRWRALQMPACRFLPSSEERIRMVSAAMLNEEARFYWFTRERFVFVLISIHYNMDYVQGILLHAPPPAPPPPHPFSRPRFAYAYCESGWRERAGGGAKEA